MLRVEGLETRALLDGAGLPPILFPTLAPQTAAFTTAPNVLKNSTLSMVVPAASVDPSGVVYSLGADAPAWAAIGRTTGLLSLSPGAGSTNAAFDVLVSDNGKAAAAQRVAVSVFSAGVIGDNVVVYGTPGSDAIQVVADGSTSISAGGMPVPMLLPGGSVVTSFTPSANGGVYVDLGGGTDSLHARGNTALSVRTGSNPGTAPGDLLDLAAWSGNLALDAGAGTIDVQSAVAALRGSADRLIVGAAMRNVAMFAGNVRCGQTLKAEAVSVTAASAQLESADFGNAILSLPQAGAAISLAGAGFGSLVVTGAGTLVDLANANFSTLDNRSAGALISVANATFQSFVNSAPGAIVDLASSTIGSILNTGEQATLNLAGATFSTLVNEGIGATINIGALNFKALVKQSSTINLGGIRFDALLNKGSGTKINLGGADFGSLVDQTASINLGGIEFDSLENTADNVTINIGGVDFGSLVEQEGEISVGAIKFGTLVNDGEGATVNLGGLNFKALVKQSSTINLGGINFNALLSKKSATINLGGADFSSLASMDSGASINLGGMEFGTLVNEGSFATLNLGGVDFGSLVEQGGEISIGAIRFDALLNKGTGSKINLGGLNFKALTKQSSTINLGGLRIGGLLNTADGVSIRTVPADFGALLGGVAGATINLGGVRIGTLLNAGEDVSIDLSDTTLTTLVNADVSEISQPEVDLSTLSDAGSRARISLVRVSFDSLVNAGSGSSVSVADGTFSTLLNSGNAAGTAIGVSGSTFQTLANYGDSATVDIGALNFKALVKQSSTINLGGVSFDSLINQGSGTTINLGGADFGALTEQTSPISAGPVAFKTLLNTADDLTINIGALNFKALVKQSSTINLGGIRFDALINKGSGSKINLGGADFSAVQATVDGGVISLPGIEIDQIINEGENVLISTGAINFNALIKKNTTINLGGIRFDALTNKGKGSKINLAGIRFGTLYNVADATAITLVDTRFSDLVNSGGGPDTRIDILGGSFLSLFNSGNGVGGVRVSGAAFGTVRNDGNGVQIDITAGEDANVLINDGSGVGIRFAAGGGDDVFVNNASCDAFHGNAVTLAVDLGVGNDRAVIGGRGIGGWLEGGSGDEQLFFTGDATGVLAVAETAWSGSDTLDFSRLTGGGVSIDLALTTAQTVRPGLTLTLSSSSGIENVVGTPAADVIRGNSRGNLLSGADAADDRVGAATPLNGRTQVVLLDFDSRTEPGERPYAVAERGVIVDRLNAIYAGFQVTFVTSAPSQGPYATVFFNQSNADGMPGGDSSEIDFGNRNLGGTAILQVNGLLGLPGGPEVTSENYVAASVWMAAHEVGHLLGLRHADSFGPIGFGANTAPQSMGLSATPVVAGAAAGWNTNGAVMATPALTGFTLADLTTSHFFSEREAVKLAFNARAPVSPDGRLLVAEQSAPHGGISSAQPLALASLPVPNALPGGFNAGKELIVAAVDVLGTVAEAGQKDVYRIEGRRGDLMNLQVMSKALDRYRASSFDAVLTVYDASGKVIATNDDEFESQDPSVIDLVLPTDGSYYLEVRGYDSTQIGSYELFAWRFDTASLTDAGDVIDGRDGSDLIVGYAGNDILFGGEGADILSGDAGDDLLVGGDGADRLFGGGDDDVLVAGEVEDDCYGIWGDPLKLWSFVAAWSTSGFRSSILRKGTSGDCSLDVLSGGQGSDWFIVSSEDRILDRSSVQGDAVSTVK